MPLTVTCTDCGRAYAVPDAAAGKRVKCKQCGHVFAIPAAAAAADEADDWAGLQSAASPSPTPAPPPPTRPGATAARALLGRINLEDQVLIALAVAAGVSAAAVAAKPSLAPAGFYAFLALAPLYLLFALIVVTRRFARRGQTVQVGWRELMSVGLGLAVAGAMAAVLPFAVFRYRRPVTTQGSVRTGHLFLILGKTLLVAAFGFALIAIAFHAGHDPFSTAVDTSPQAVAMRQQTADTLHRLSQAVTAYRHQHAGRAPADLAALSLAADEVTSPYDPAAGSSAYGYLPHNVGLTDRAILYDAAELRATDHAEVILDGSDEAQTETRAVLSARARTAIH